MNTTEHRGMQAGRIPLSYYENKERFVPLLIEEFVEGIDTSKWNGDMNYVVSKNAGADFVYVKATQGISIQDAQFQNSRTKLKGLLPWGAYHYLLSTYSGITQANYFCDVTEDYFGELPPVLDVELTSVSAKVVKDFCITVYGRLGVYPLIYTSVYFWDKVVGLEKTWCTQNCELFVAHWGTLNPILPSGWTTFAVHQYDADGNQLGITYGAPPPPIADCDMDLDRAKKSWLDKYTTLPTIPLPYSKVEVVVDSLNIRSGPSISSSIIGSLVKGNRPEKLEIRLENGNIWIRIGWKQWAALKYNNYIYMKDI